jgi:uncharacterized protein (DUF2235 family)
VKRLIVCCDGTWSEPDQGSVTNVVKVAMAVAERDSSGVEQRVFYNVGLGTTRGERLRGGAFGFRLSQHVRDCYRFLVETYDPGDELYFFGFSRGAYTARSTAGLVRNSGILRREHEDRIGEAYALYRARGAGAHPRETRASLFRRSFSHEPDIHFVGVWDTVGALGIPVLGPGWVRVVNRRWAFHDTALSTKVKLAYQALAIDERRGPFEPTLWTRQGDATNQVLEQVWFAGVHSDVGGGYADSALSDIPLLWLVDRAAAAGLDFTAGSFSGAVPQDEHLADEARRSGRLVQPRVTGEVHDSLKGVYRWVRQHVRSPGTAEMTLPDGTRAVAAGQSIASSVDERVAGDAGYGADGLREFLRGGGAVTTVRTEPGMPDQ